MKTAKLPDKIYLPKDMQDAIDQRLKEFQALPVSKRSSEEAYAQLHRLKNQSRRTFRERC